MVCGCYIGKGTGNRIFQHELEESKSSLINTQKVKVIHNLKKQGYQPERLILHYGLTENEAFAAETSLINMARVVFVDTLTNIMSGHHGDFAMTVEEFDLIYGAETLSLSDITYNVLVIKINKLYQRGMSQDEIKEITRGHWKISLEKARKTEYLFAVYHGLIVAIFEKMEWFNGDKITDSYPRPEVYTPSILNRKYCTCETVNDDSQVAQKYLYKNLIDFTRNTQNPVSYIWGKK